MGVIGNNMELNKDTKVKSVTIRRASNISDAERVRMGLTADDFIEVMVVENSPLEMITNPIKGSQMPTEGFKKSLKDAGLIGKKFDF